MHFNFDSWPNKLLVVGGLLLACGLVRLLQSWARGGPFHESLSQVLETLESATIALGLVLLIVQPFIVQTFWVPSGSMENTLLTGDRILVSRFIYRVSDPQPGDVVVFRAPEEALLLSGQPAGTDFVKRCIGTSGDVIEIKNRVLYRNGLRISEAYTRWGDGDPPAHTRFAYDLKIVGDGVYYRMYDALGHVGNWQRNEADVDQADQDLITESAPGKVPPGQYLMLGDHRDQSLDGHCWGFVANSDLVGRAFCIFWPLNRLELLDHVPR